MKGNCASFPPLALFLFQLAERSRSVRRHHSRGSEQDRERDQNQSEELSLIARGEDGGDCRANERQRRRYVRAHGALQIICVACDFGSASKSQQLKILYEQNVRIAWEKWCRKQDSNLRPRHYE
jgi:hypothetical protein